MKNENENIRKDSLMRRCLTELTKTLDLLQDELCDIIQVVYLQELLCELTRVDDSEYGEYVVVD